jgi:hypothetical protein
VTSEERHRLQAIVQAWDEWHRLKTEATRAEKRAHDEFDTFLRSLPDVGTVRIDGKVYWSSWERSGRSWRESQQHQPGDEVGLDLDAFREQAK